jgi:hypothetical protein
MYMRNRMHVCVYVLVRTGGGILRAFVSAADINANIQDKIFVLLFIHPCYIHTLTISLCSQTCTVCPSSQRKFNAYVTRWIKGITLYILITRTLWKKSEGERPD